ncbi:MFS transporter [Marinospirillum alkaliphilum]|uniref:MFS transporter, YNFM family, putative membrane transport protein n=1 Tax=Marinospirillum alkaliphilum DSM 21637 TaxID=1122209 RepID=A0A1K1YI48_9GAMM|nr:MFS transporter [Marinospirillum alkaliphilum]SFX61067.1 MFS transporter, YNFM family, putative membrane transport protein [Marinospirillum alkaliphilum DSM 21637]
MIEEKTPAFWRATLALCCGSFMIFSNLYVTQPLLPDFQQAFGISTLQANASLAVATLTLGLSLLVYGPLSDAVGRRAIMLITMSGVLITTLALAHVPDYTSLVLLRALQGFLLGGLPAIAIAYMGDEFSKRAMALAVGIYISANSLGGISGRLFSGLIADVYDWRASFLSAALLSLVCLVVFWWALPKSRHFSPQSPNPVRMLKDLGKHLRNPLLLPVYLIGGLNFFIFVNQYSYVTYLLAGEPWLLSSSLLGMLFLTYLTGTWGASISGRVALVLAQPLCMALGILLLMTGTLLMLIPSLWAIIGGLFINSFGFFFCHSNASSWVSRQALTSRASANGLYLVFYYLGASSGGFYLDPFWSNWGWGGVIGASLLVFGVTLLISLALWRKDPRPLSQIN